MENFDYISKGVKDINDYSQEVVNDIDDLKRYLIGFMVNRDYDDIYDYLDCLLKSIESIRDSGVLIGWLTEFVLKELDDLKNSNN